MAVSLSHDLSGGDVLVIVDGRFTFDIYRDFLDAVNPVIDSARRVTVDLRDAEHLDCAGLGLLVQLYDKLRHIDLTLRVKKGSPVEQLLTIASFDRLFTLEAA